MRGSTRRDTKPELALRSELHRRGLRFRVDFPIEARGRRVRADVAFPRQRVAVFVDGCFWHRCPEHGRKPEVNLDYWQPKFRRNVERDRAVDAALRAAGWDVVRLWEHETVIQGANVVQRAVRERAGS
ncbi:MAG: very short patch repair endonuclease [Actinomycetota bacterium]|nr:very short patch repair endonuclease [Actinomycetota bacterium]